MSLIGVGAILTTLSACGAVAHLESIRRECGIADDVFLPLPYGAQGAYTEISLGCSESLGSEVGLDWASFGESPREISWPEDTTDFLIGGLFVVVASDLGDVGALCSEHHDFGVVATECEGWDGPATSPAGALWLSQISHAIDETVAGDPGDEAGMRFDDGTALVSFRPSADDTISSIEDAAHRASAFVHESSHLAGLPHVPCNSDGRPVCDDDGNGSWGAELAFLSGWFAHNSNHLSSEDCETFQWVIDDVCDHINGQDDLAECAEAPECGTSR